MMVGEDSEAGFTDEPLGIGSTFTVGNLIYKLTSAGAVEVADTIDEVIIAAEIPSTVTYGTISPESYNVTSIGDNAFEDCMNLTSVTIPDSVKSIGEFAFAFCDGLTSVILTDGIKTIGVGAFALCSLESITIPDSVEYIGYYAFRGTPLETVIFESDDCPELTPSSFATNTELMVYTPGWDPIESMSSAISDDDYGLYEDTVVVWANDPSKVPDLSFLSTPSSGTISYIGRSAA